MTTGDRWFFRRVARGYDWVMPSADTEALASGLAVATRPVERVLDVGGGTGRAARAMTVPDRVVIDATAAMLRRVPADIERVQASATHLPMADESADAVVVADALHHFPDHQRVVAELRRVLRPGGVAVIREFDRGSIRGRLLEFAEHAIGMESTFHRAAELRSLLADGGFEATEVLEPGFTTTVVGRKPGGP